MRAACLFRLIALAHTAARGSSSFSRGNLRLLQEEGALL